jgi:hypothetical protein
VCSHRPMINWVAVVWGFRCDTQVSVRSFPLSSVVFLFCSVYCLLSILSSRCQLIGLDAHYGGPHLYFVLERHALFMCLFFCTPRFLICFTSQDNDFQLGIRFTYIIIFPPDFYCCYTRCEIHRVVRQGAHLNLVNKIITAELATTDDTPGG